MKILFEENRGLKRHGAHPTLFLSTLFFVAGVRLQNIPVILALLFPIFIAILLVGKVWFPEKVGAKFLGKVTFAVGNMAILAASMLCGILYHWQRISPTNAGEGNRIRGYVTATLEAKTITIKDEKCGIFYGYGKIRSIEKRERATGHSKQIKSGPIGEYVFFSVGDSPRGEIPVPGQKFTVGGNLKFVGDGEREWFLRHLKNSHVNWHISNCYLLSCDGPVPQMGLFSRKTADKFSALLATGVGDRAIEVGILSAMLTGSKPGMDPVSRTMFNDLGIAHLFAVSGIHVGVIGATIDMLLRVLGIAKRVRPFPSLLFLVFYVNAIGCSPSSVRALVMVAFYYAATLLGRRPNVLSALGNSALLHVLYDPIVAFYISFLLSYSVVAGIILIRYPLRTFLARTFLNLHGVKLDAYPRYFRLWFHFKASLLTSLAISISAYLASLPLSVGYFGVISLFTVVVNVIVVPIATCAIIAGTMTLLCGLCGLLPMCTLLNKISCAFVGLFRLLSQGFHTHTCCLRNFNPPFAL
jgi:ComEC/Rec2-related protein